MRKNGLKQLFKRWGVENRDRNDEFTMKNLKRIDEDVRALQIWLCFHSLEITENKKKEG